MVQVISCFVASASKGRSSLPCTHDYLTHPFPQYLHSVHMTLPEVQQKTVFASCFILCQNAIRLFIGTLSLFLSATTKLVRKLGSFINTFKCDSRKYPYTPPPSHGWSMEIPGGQGAKGEKFPRGAGGDHEKNFPQGCKRRDRSHETYLSICGLF